MLAERFLPRFFEQVAMTAAVDAKGQCSSLAHLEESGSGGTSAAATPKKSTRKEPEEAEPSSGTPESATLAEWMASQPILAWAKVQPPIAKEDLRPYLFVTKDRKDYFGAGIALGHLAPLVEKMFGPKIAVQRLEGELRQLVPAEAAQIFETIRSRIAGSDTFDVPPPGIDGLAILVRAQPALQNSLIDLLEAIPVSRYGPWVVSGWEGVIVEPTAIQRFEQLLQRWAAGSNAVLKIAASGALRVRAGSRR